MQMVAGRWDGGTPPDLGPAYRRKLLLLIEEQALSRHDAVAKTLQGVMSLFAYV